MTRKFLGLSAAALMLAGCGGGDNAAESGDGEDSGPQGEVRGGTISDAMLPVAMVQSQSPKRGGDSDEAASDENDGSEADGDDAQ